jgi:hypothetical protein
MCCFGMEATVHLDVEPADLVLRLDSATRGTYGKGDSVMDDQTWARMERVLHEERGVSREIASERGYRPFDPGDTRVRELFPNMSNRQWGATFGRLVKRTSGIVIPKHPVPGRARSRRRVGAQHLLEDPDVVIQGNRVLHLRYRVRR